MVRLALLWHFFGLRTLIVCHLFNFVLVFVRDCSARRKDKLYFDSLIIEIYQFQTPRFISKVAFSPLSFAIAIGQHASIENDPLMEIEKFSVLFCLQTVL